MGDQLQPVQATQKWYAKPQVLIPAAGIGYLFLNKKTRKTALLGSGAFLAFMGFKSRSEGSDYLSTGFGNAALVLGGALIFLGLRKKK